MTLPDERYRAVQNARNFLMDLLNPKKTPKVPRNIRLMARSVLKHFPSEFEMALVANEMQGVFDLPYGLRQKKVISKKI